ncbi:hypothetical protein HMPREF9466_02988 [Fusobacterium necrophorum subsp. funduliforme 1_1_36S]|nr:hypothetical protein HMPREF9466_02988 [Fusobacterium necrophorum subsp. funduliforme 1_1_36S]
MDQKIKEKNEKIEKELKFEFSLNSNEKQKKLEEYEKKVNKINEEFLSEKQKIDMEIGKLKDDLKDEEVQEFLTVLDRKESSETTIKHLEKLKEENMKRENPMMKKKTMQAIQFIRKFLYIQVEMEFLSIRREQKVKKNNL